MKAMISQLMHGKSNIQIRAEREELVKRLEDKGYEVIDTVLDISEGKSPIYYLAKSIELLDQADIIVFMEGWDKARGCRIEYDIATKYGKYVEFA